MGSFAVLSLLWLAGQNPGEIVHINQRSLQIPVNIQPGRQAEIREMLLFASTDEGRTWQQVAAAAPTKDSFIFHAPADGLYWFRVGLINNQGKQEPENIMQGPPDMRIHIDTLRPLVRIQAARREGEEVVVAWDIQDQNLDPAGMRLEYAAQGASAGTAVNVAPGAREARFRPAVPGPLIIRLLAKDFAGNFGQATAEVAGGTMTPSPVPLPSGLNLTAHTTQAVAPAVPVAPPIEEPIAPPVSTKPNNWGQAVTAPQGRVIASSDIGLQQVTNGAPAVRKTLPAIQYVNGSEVNLEYELSRVGPSGVANVELWWTQNDGQTWQQYAVDDAIRQAIPGGRYQRLLELPGDGLYGFLLIAKSAAGRGRALPKPGDAPEVRIEVDTVPPFAQLYVPQPDPRTPQTLVVTWLAKDANLAATPVTLEWSGSHDGPWQPIAANLPNTGRYPWHLPESLPVQVFMRIRVRDAAGNEGVAQTAEPQLVDLAEPEGRIVNVSVPRR